MKTLKMASLFIAYLIMFLLSACKSSDVDPTTSTEVPDIYKKYMVRPVSHQMVPTSPSKLRAHLITRAYIMPLPIGCMKILAALLLAETHLRKILIQSALLTTHLKFR